MNTATKPKPIPERLERLGAGEIPLLVGSHTAPDPSCTHPKGCDREIRSWVLGLPWGRDLFGIPRFDNRLAEAGQDGCHERNG